MNKYSVTKLPGGVQADLAKRHTLLRKQKGYSQAELAESSGVSLGSLRRFEQTGKISLENLLALMHILQRLDDFDQVLQPIENLKAIEKLFEKAEQ